MPKGAILTHANAVAALVGPKMMDAIEGTPGDTILSFLPLAHIYERENVNMNLYAGMRMGFFHGDVTGVTSLLSAFANCLAPRRYSEPSTHDHHSRSTCSLQNCLCNSICYNRRARHKRENLSSGIGWEIRSHDWSKPNFPPSCLGSSLESKD